jgi:Sulfite exporter TauE/SafE
VQSDAAFHRDSDHDDLGYGHRPLAPANLRQSTTCKGDTVTRPSANGTADSVTTAPTLPSSLPAAEFRLPLLIGVFGFLALQAVIMNKAMSLIVVLTALPARLAAVPIDALTPYWFVVVNLLAGSLIGAWIGATWATRMRSATLYRVLAALLVLIAAALASSHLGHLDPLTIQPVPRAIIGLLAGVGMGVVAALMGVAGGELLIPRSCCCSPSTSRSPAASPSPSPYPPCWSRSPATAAITASKPSKPTRSSFSR